MSVMSYHYCDVVEPVMKELVRHLTSYEEDSHAFQHVFENTMQKLQVADTMFFPCQKDVDRSVESFYDKFHLHGFIKQANILKSLYDKFVGKTMPKEDLKNRLSAMVLLFSLSTSPTTYWAANLEKQACHTIQDEGDIDWGLYLKEGIDVWNPPSNSDSESWSDDESTVSSSNYENSVRVDASFQDSEEAEIVVDRFQQIRLNRQIIMDSIQNPWVNSTSSVSLPRSKAFEANLVFKWLDHITSTTNGLLKFDHPNVLPEYKVLREIIWQLWGAHSSTSFKFVGDSLVPRENITISSTRPNTFQHFMSEFLGYINALEKLREFQRDILTGINTPETCKSYCSSLNNILQPALLELVKLEDDIMKQDETATLLTLASKLRSIFKPVMVLKVIHSKVAQFEQSSRGVRIATSLLAQLRHGLETCETKMEQDIYLCLYLDALFEYARIIDHWLSDGILQDEKDEFPILRCTDEMDLSWQHEFAIKELDEAARSDAMIKIITTQVLQYGKYIHLLKRLGKLITVATVSFGYLHEQLIERTLQKISEYFGCNTEETEDEGIVMSPKRPKGPTICPNFCNYITEMDNVENLVDFSDTYMLEAFQNLIVFDPDDPPKTKKELSLYERIQTITTHTFPVNGMIDSIFSDILNERYSETKKYVIELFNGEFRLYEHLTLLKHVFLFKDNIIHPFYTRIFQKLEKESDWGYTIWLTCYLQNILMDVHPEFYENVLVLVKDSWRESIGDSLKSCSLVKLEYDVPWPVNIIITNETMDMYKEMFHFILQIKWALYTVDQLHFDDLKCSSGKKIHSKHERDVVARLKILRFCLINLFNSVQHYVMGYVFNKCSLEFDDRLKNCYDLDSLIVAHKTFIKDLHKLSTVVRDYNETSYGFNLLLYLAKKMKAMWRNSSNVEPVELHKCERNYKLCYAHLNDIVNPSSN